MAYCLTLYGGWESGTLSPSTTYFIGGDNYNSTRTGLTGASGNANTNVEIPKSGTIKSIYVKMNLVAGSSNENVAHFIRINDTTDIGEIDFNYVQNGDGSSAPNTAVNTGDFIAFKIVTPAWLGIPTGVRWYCMVYIE